MLLLLLLPLLTSSLLQNRKRAAAGKPASSTPDADDWIIVDKVQVPQTKGDFVLRWRWDTEQNPQVWSHCADITVV